jgi:hypothetical protein
VRGGEAALLEGSRHQKLLKNRVAPPIEAAVVELALKLPADARIRIGHGILVARTTTG